MPKFVGCADEICPKNSLADSSKFLTNSNLLVLNSPGFGAILAIIFRNYRYREGIGGRWYGMQKGNYINGIAVVCPRSSFELLDLVHIDPDCRPIPDHQFVSLYQGIVRISHHDRIYLYFAHQRKMRPLVLKANNGKSGKPGNIHP